MALESAFPSEARRAPAGVAAATLPLYVGAILLSAFLLFAVQPMFTKMVLPVLGGTPAVWSIALVFFQALLLAGYGYAHLLARHASTRTALVLHLALMLGACLALPIGLPGGWGKPPAEGEALWLLGLFAVAVGPPFFALAANGPLLQAWFSRSAHAQAGDPYFLYAASNVGSFAALVAYPLAIEPFLTLQQQSRSWFAGFAALAALIAGCGLIVRAARPSAAPAAIPAAIAAAAPTAAPSWRERASWVGLSFVPSGLLVSVTAHISTDIAAAPLLWVVPMALFLLTFVLTFRDRPLIATGSLVRLQVWGTALAFITNTGIPRYLWLSLALHLGLFVVNAMLCHGALYRRRPPAARLTEFYLWMSVGGVLGGISCGLVAPQVFSGVLEYPILLAAALFCRPGFLAGDRRAWAGQAGLTAALCLAAAALWWAGGGLLVSADKVGLVPIVAFGAWTMIHWRSPAQVAPAALAMLLAWIVLLDAGKTESTRSFFGVHRLLRSDDGRFLLLAHGTTVHGAIRLGEDGGTGRPEPTTYYTYDGAIGTGIKAIRAARGGTLGSVAAIGLGAGTLACHAAPGEAWTFLEIDREVLRLAADPRRFRFLSGCAPGLPVVLGDARITLADRPGRNGLIIVDAFSSDAIPAHLITREAFGLYLDRLDPAGVVMVHISNRHLELGRILARVGAEHGLTTWIIREPATEPLEQRFRTPSVVAVLAREPAHLGALAGDPAWRRVAPDLARPPWTDDFSNILQALWDHARP